MGLFDLPAPILDAIDGVFAAALPPAARLVLWGVVAGWVTMLLYRSLSNQERIKELKQAQKRQQAAITAFDGEFDELLPLIRNTLSLGFRQLGLAIGPALLATVPVLFLLAFVSGEFGYRLPEPGQAVALTATPEDAGLHWRPAGAATPAGESWTLKWPAEDSPVSLELGNGDLLRFPLQAAVPVIHTRRWWNTLFANPLGYIPDGAELERLDIGLAPQQFVGFGPGWVRGWMFTFFGVFLVASLAFKLLMRID